MSAAPSGFQAAPQPPEIPIEHQLLADVRLVAQLADQDVRRFAADVLEACAAADAAQGAPGDVTTDEIRALLQRTADGR